MRVRYEKRGRVAYVTFDRPEVLNAMDLATHEELARVWDDFEADDDLSVAVLTGTGDRAFSVGQDLKELAVHSGLGRRSPRCSRFSVNAVCRSLIASRFMSLTP
ncbi:enoyl-CoA hydratase-related protein [Nonomuraea basaltis]|uniref:enoyl-CoA hydratase-related protein n=1 Tax=Nonomuraea basaltis TaxID=2495887 RepID=UPI00197F885A|nr:enoyl-CoA hydratase-related protein [Nonomuraea basaltis]